MSVDKSGHRVRQMFGEIASRYDFLNHLLSLSMDRYWRWRAIRKTPPEGKLPILDICTGTGDLALGYRRHVDAEIPVLATDFCHEMLLLGAKKVSPGKPPITWIEADSQRLPFPDGMFQIVSVAFDCGIFPIPIVDCRRWPAFALLGGLSWFWNFQCPSGSPFLPSIVSIFAIFCPGLDNSWLRID